MPQKIENKLKPDRASQPLTGNFIVPKCNYALSVHFSINPTDISPVHNVKVTPFFFFIVPPASIYFICPVISYGTWPCKMLSRILLNRRRGAKRMPGRRIVIPKRNSLKEIHASDSFIPHKNGESYFRDIWVEVGVKILNG